MEGHVPQQMAPMCFNRSHQLVGILFVRSYETCSASKVVGGPLSGMASHRLMSGSFSQRRKQDKSVSVTGRSRTRRP
jgi:hypothetical protein